MKPVYVTFQLDFLFLGRKKFAVLCEVPGQAETILFNASGLAKVKYVKLNHCGRLVRDSQIMTAQEYQEALSLYTQASSK